MGQTFKRIIALVITGAIILTPIQLQAETTTDSYSELFQQAMEFISDHYLDKDEITQEELFRGAMQGMFGILDPYSKFMTYDEVSGFTDAIDGSYVGVGIQLDAKAGVVYVERVFDGSPAGDAGVKRGDTFLAVDGEDVTGYDIQQLLKLLLGEENTQVEVTFSREQMPYTVEMTRSRITAPMLMSEDIRDYYDGLTDEEAAKIGYIQINSFSEDVGAAYANAYAALVEDGMQYLVLDLRDNGGGYVSAGVELAQQIVPEGPIVTFIDADGNENTFSSELKEAVVPMVVLINEHSASATEFVAGAIQDTGAGILVGETTFGKGVSQYLFDFGGDYGIKLTMEAFYTPLRNPINGVGITPDHIVEVPTYMAGTERYYLNDDLPAVLELEKILSYLGYDVGIVDSVYDRSTFNAVKKFQIDQKLYGYGVCDYGTQKALNAALYGSILEKDRQLEKAVQLLLGKSDEK